MDMTPVSMLERLERLERDNRLLKAVGLGVAAAFALLALAGPVRGASGAVPSVLEARRFVLRDESGQVRGVLGFEDGRPRLILRDQDGAVVADIGGDGRTFPARP